MSVAMGMAVSTVVAAMLGATMWRERTDALEHARQQADNLALVAQRDIQRNIELYSLSLRAMAEGWRRPDVQALPADLRRSVIFDRAIEATNVSAAVLDASGRVAANLRYAALMGRDFSDRSYFRVHLDDAAEGVTVSEPIASTAENGQYIIALSRRIARLDGSFGGVAVIFLKVDYFRGLLQGLDIGPHGRTTVFGPGGRVVMSLPYQEGLIGKDRSATELHRRASASEAGSFEIDSPVDGARRLVAFRAVQNGELRVLVSPALSDIYGPWRARAAAVGAIAALFAAVLTGLSWALGRALAARASAERARARGESLLRGITDNVPALIAYIDADERYQFANRAFQSWLGREPSTLMGKQTRALMRPDLYAERGPLIAKALSGERVEFESEGAPLGIRRITRNIYVPDVGGDGTVKGIYTLSTDVTEMKDIQARLAEQARVDLLTGLPNRLASTELLPQALARHLRTDEPLALMFLDIDHFKRVNDTLGHAAGDAVLMEFARRIKRAVRSTDVVARLGGDEFIILLEAIGSRAATAAVAAKVRTLVASEPFALDEGLVAATTSIGVAYLPPGGAMTNADKLLAWADAALYTAKALGRNRYEFAV